jgi:hypothetical protein
MTAAMQLSIVTLGHVHTEDLTALQPHFTKLEQLVLDIPPRAPLSAHRAELNRAVDAGTSDWILIVREREVIDEPLAKEIAGAVAEARARGFRIRSTAIYAGKPLHIDVDRGRDGGELRLFHRRYFLRRAEPAVQGPVVRLANAFRSITFATPEEHRRHLAEHGKARSPLARMLVFVSYLVGTRTLDGNTLRYLWIEAGYGLPTP